MKKLRIEKNITQEKLAKMAGISQGFLSKIENGMKLDIFTADKIACALEISIDYLLRREDL